MFLCVCDFKCKTWNRIDFKEWLFETKLQSEPIKLTFKNDLCVLHI